MFDITICHFKIFQVLFKWIILKLDFPFGLDGKNLPAMPEIGVQSLGEENPLEKVMGT